MGEEGHNWFSVKARNMSALAAFAVVVIHAGNGGMGSFAAKMAHQFLGWGLCTFAVPWFFFASGYFFARHLDEKGWWVRAVRTRLRSLFLPYLFWCSLFIGFSFVLDVLLNLSAERALMSGISARRLLLCGFGLEVSEHPLLVPFWYIRALLIIVLLSPVLVWGLRRLRWFIPALMVPVYVYCCAFHDRYAMPWFIFFSLFSVAGWIYFSVGVLARFEKWEPRTCRVPTWLCWTVALSLIIGGRLALYGGFTILSNGLWIAAIPPLMLGVWRLVPGRAWPTGLVAAAFPLYALHYFFEHFLETTFLPLGAPAFSAYLLRIVLVLSLSLAVANLMRVLSPQIAQILWGGRGVGKGR